MRPVRRRRPRPAPATPVRRTRPTDADGGPAPVSADDDVVDAEIVDDETDGPQDRK